MELRKLQMIELDMLKYFDSFCKEHNLAYYLFGGTLIGAVRHKGFIPWDDDIDLAMKREDYMRLVECWQRDNHNTRYKLLSLYTSEEHYYPYIKIVDTRYKCVEAGGRIKGQNELGVWIDIFPLDAYSDKNNVSNKIKIEYMKYSYSKEPGFCFGNKCKKHPWLIPLKVLVHLLWRNPRKYALKIDKLAQSCKEQTDELFAGTSGIGEKDVFDAKWFKNSTLLSFEDELFPCPIGYHEYLTHRYGDYMQLPPESEREAKHELIIEEKH